MLRKMSVEKEEAALASVMERMMAPKERNRATAYSNTQLFVTIDINSSLIYVD